MLTTDFNAIAALAKRFVEGGKWLATAGIDETLRVVEEPHGYDEVMMVARIAGYGKWPLETSPLTRPW